MEPKPEPTDLPPLFARHVRRPRLTRLINESKAQSVVLIAPAGYGKTTLAREWAQGRQDVVWYHATSASADIAAFSVGIAEVMSKFVPGAGERLRQRILVAEQRDNAARSYAELFAADIASWPVGYWLMIDDYHFVADSTPVEEFIDWVLTLTGGLRLLVTTRRRPAWLSARRVLHAEVTEIGRDQLAMGHDEAADLLAGRTSEAVRALVQSAEGWPVLLGLAALAAASEIPSDRISEELFRYLADEVFHKQSSEIQDFMLRAAIPYNIDLRSASTILGVGHSEAIVDSLESDGLLRRSEPGIFVFHPLVREFLKQKISREKPETATAIAERALVEARLRREWDKAFALAIQLGRLVAAEVVGEAQDDLLARGRIRTLGRWLESCGPEGFVQPTAVLAHAELRIRQGRLLEAAAIARDLASRLPSQHAQASRAWYIAGRAYYLCSQYQSALDCHTAARAAATTPEATKEALWGLLLTSTELELESTGGFLCELAALEPKSLDDRLRLATGRITVGAHAGTLADVWSHVEPLLPQARHAHDPMARTTFTALAAYLCVARVDYDRALSLAKQALDDCIELGLSFAAAFCLIHKTNAEIGLRTFRQAKQTLRLLAKSARDSNDPFVLLAEASLNLKCCLASHGAEAAASLPSHPLPRGELPSNAYGELLALRALVLAGAGASKDARGFIEAAREKTRAIEAQLYTAFAEAILSLRDSRPVERSEYEPANVLRRALAADFADSFVLAYRAYPPLLAAFRADSSLHSAVTSLTAMARDVPLAKRFGLPTISLSSALNPLPPQLTPREQEILMLLAEGLSNAEIAKRLFIARSTAKVHVHHILEKLGVENRLQAALRSADLQDRERQT